MIDVFVLALATTMTAAMPPKPIWTEIGRYETMDACILARKALPPWRQHYAGCFNAEELAALQP